MPPVATETTSEVFFNAEPEVDYVPHLGRQVGIWSDLSVSDRFSVRTEALYSRQLLEVEEDGGERFHTQLDFASLPVLLTYQIENWRIAFGPEVGYLTRSQLCLDGDCDDRHGTFSENHFEEFSLALNLGVRYHFSRFHVGLRANHALLPITIINLRSLDGSLVGERRTYLRMPRLSLGVALTTPSSHSSPNNGSSAPLP